MARIDFYILSTAGERFRRTFACRLAEKAYRLDNTVHIHTPDAAAVSDLDDLLWTFRDGSFVPHQVVDARDSDRAAPVTIGCSTPDAVRCDLLINLCDEIPDFAESFPRVAELISSDEACRRAGRVRFATYRDRGHTLDTHKV